MSYDSQPLGFLTLLAVYQLGGNVLYVVIIAYHSNHPSIVATPV